MFLLLQLLQVETPLGRYASAPLFALALGLALAASNVLPLQSPAYDVVWNWLMPLATSLFLLENADVSRCGTTALHCALQFAVILIGAFMSRNYHMA